MSWKAQFQTGGSDWAGNSLRFKTKEEAESYASNLMMRWMAVSDSRVVESEDSANYKWVGKLEALN